MAGCPMDEQAWLRLGDTSRLPHQRVVVNRRDLEAAMWLIDELWTENMRLRMVLTSTTEGMGQG